MCAPFSLPITTWSIIVIGSSQRHVSLAIETLILGDDVVATMGTAEPTSGRERACVVRVRVIAFAAQ